MIRTVLKPQHQDISIKLPKNFVGQRVEVIAFTLDEADETITIANDLTVTHFASEANLAKDWLTSAEDLAWRDL